MLKTLFYWGWAIQMQVYWTLVVTGGLFAGWYWGGSLICFVLMLVSIAATIGDVRGRIFVEYRTIRREIKEAPGYYEYVRLRDKWLRAQKFAPCRRFATGAAFRDVAATRRYYQALGYRWWHVFPDEFYLKMWSAEYWRKALFKH